MICPRCKTEMKKYEGLKEVSWDCINPNCGKEEIKKEKEINKDIDSNDFIYYSYLVPKTNLENLRL